MRYKKLGVEAWEQSMTKAWSRDLGTGLISKIKDSYVSNGHTNTTGIMPTRITSCASSIFSWGPSLGRSVLLRI